MKLAFSLILVATLIPAPTALGGPSVLTAAEVDAFIERAERELSEDAIRSNRIGWINETYITDDTDALVAEAEAESTALSMRLAIEAAPLLATPGVSEASRRKLSFLVGGVGLPGPTRAGATQIGRAHV